MAKQAKLDSDFSSNLMGKEKRNQKGKKQPEEKRILQAGKVC